MRRKRDILKDYLEKINKEKNLRYTPEEIQDKLDDPEENKIIEKLLQEDLYETEEWDGQVISTINAFKTYCTIILKNDFKTGDYIWNNFVKQQFILVEKHKLTCYMAPRGHGKSFFIGLYSSFKMYLIPYFDVGYCSNIPRQRRRFLIMFESIIDTNEFLIEKKDVKGINNRSVFWGMEDLVYNKGTLEGTTVGTTPRGGHYNLAIGDDPLRDDKKYTYEFIVNYFQGVYKQTVLRKKGRYIIVGTPQDPEDLFHVLMNSKLDKNNRPLGKLLSDGLSAAGFRSKLFQAITDHKTKTILVPEIWSYEELMIEKTRIGEIRFNRELMCQCMTHRNSLVSSSLFRSCCDEKLGALQKGEIGKKYIIAVDSATSDSPTADNCAMNVWEDDVERDKLILRNLFHDKGVSITDPTGGDDDQTHILYRLWKDFNKALVIIEKNNAGIALIQSIQAMCAKRNESIDVIEHYTHDTSTGRVSQKSEDVINYIEHGLKAGVIVFPSNPEDYYTIEILEKVKTEHLNFGVKKGKSGEKYEAIAGKDDIFDTCFPKGHLVKTKEGYKDISTVKIGDLVLTHKNHYRKVVNKMKRKVDEKLIELNMSGCPDKIVCTKDHPFYVTTMDKFQRAKQFNKSIGEKFTWVSADSLKGRKIKSKHFLDMGISPIKKYGFKKKVNSVFKYLDGFERFIGLYLAEGSCSHHGIALAFHKEEFHLINFCLDFLKRNGFNANTQVVGNCCRVYCQKMILKKFFKPLGKSNNKSLPPYLSDCFGIGLVKGWLEGDGYFDKNSCISGSSISKKMIYQMRDVLQYNKIVCNIKRVQRGNNTFPNSKDIFVLSLNKENTDRLLFGKCNGRRHNTGIVFYNNHFLTGFNKAIKQFKGNVYNLSVEDDESYIVEGVKVHNCWTGFKFRGNNADTIPYAITMQG